MTNLTQWENWAWRDKSNVLVDVYKLFLIASAHSEVAFFEAQNFLSDMTYTTSDDSYLMRYAKFLNARHPRAQIHLITYSLFNDLKPLSPADPTHFWNRAHMCCSQPLFTKCASQGRAQKRSDTTPQSLRLSNKCENVGATGYNPSYSWS